MQDFARGVIGLRAYTTDDSGLTVEPETSEEWRDWVAASRTRNWCERDPLLDWLHLYGDAKGFERDPEPDPRTDFQAFVFRQGHAFEAAVVEYLAKRDRVCRMDGSPEWLRSMGACEQTFAAMRRGEPIIHQGLLRNPENRSYGAPDFLIRSDVLRRLFPDAISESEARHGAPGLEAQAWHYRVVDAKFNSLQFDRNWHAGANHLAYMVQTVIYSAALGRIQGYLPGHSYLLGRGWRKGAADGSTSSMDRLAPVSPENVVRGEKLRAHAEHAIDWVRRVRREGASWDPRIRPCARELLPNPKNAANHPWHRALAALARDLEDVTLAWQVGSPGRERAHVAGIDRWTDPRLCAAVLGLTGRRAALFDRALGVNRDPHGPTISPARISAAVDEWGTPRAVEFFVDFETVSNLADDFARVPDQNGQALIFMIGCGHVEDGQWQFSCFVADALDIAGEGAIVEAWLGHMESVRLRLAPEVRRPLVFHWSPAETATFGGLSSARSRNADRAQSWAEPNWFDFLDRVMRREPVIVRGPMGFGLKTVARSLKEHGLIETSWDDSVTDGLGAMMAAWWCADEANRLGRRLADIDLMADVSAYNEVDCRVMMEVNTCLRARTSRGEHPTHLELAAA
jgi:hypothetical protein